MVEKEVTLRLGVMCIAFVREFCIKKLGIYLSRESYLSELQRLVGRIKHSLYQS